MTKQKIGNIVLSDSQMTAERSIEMPDKALTVAGLDDITLRAIGYVGTLPEVGGSDPYQMVVSNKRIQVLNPSAAMTVKLPTTGIVAGEEITIVNQSTANLVSVQSSGGNAIDSLHRGYITLVALVDTPTTAAHWFMKDYTSFYIVGAALVGIDETRVVAFSFMRNANVCSLHMTATSALFTKDGLGPVTCPSSPPWFAPDAAKAMAFRGISNSVKDDLSMYFSGTDVLMYQTDASGQRDNIPDNRPGMGWWLDQSFTFNRLNS